MPRPSPPTCAYAAISPAHAPEEPIKATTMDLKASATRAFLVALLMLRCSDSKPQLPGRGKEEKAKEEKAA